MTFNCALMGDNLLSKPLYPTRTLVATEEPAGTEAWRISTARRSDKTNRWTPTSTNTQMDLTLTCDRVRAANGFVLDRGHNLGGKEVLLQCSQDNFTTVETIFDITLPSASGAGSLDDALGVRTEEGAWVIRVPRRAATYWRIRIPAMGAGVKPVIVGAWLGPWYQPARFWDWPYGEDTTQLIQALTESDAGWRGTDRRTLRRAEQLPLRMDTPDEYELARYPLSYLFASGYPTWLCTDTNQAERTILVQSAGQTFGMRQQADWLQKRKGVLDYVEYEPLAGV